MSKEKQIEEMAKVLCEDCAINVAPCDLNKSGIMCDAVREQAEALYNAGYRKQSEGRWTPRHKDTKAFCTKCGALRDIETQEFWSFCPNCGAKMKGGVTETS